MTNGDEITLRGMRFHAAVGILPHEATLPQPLEIDLTVWRRAGHPAVPAELRTPGAAVTRPVLDYRELYALAASAVAEGPIAYLEDIAEQVAGRALALAGVERTRVAVRKPHVALPGPLAHAEIVIERERHA